MKQVILTGDRPTGRLHVGHYVGSLKERVELQNSGQYDEIYIMIADAQALTDNAEHPEKVRQNIVQVALVFALLNGVNASMSALEAISKHMEILLEIYPEKKVVNDMKKHIVYYVKGKKGGKEIKLAAFKAQSVKELKEIASYI